ncbi:ATP-binding cassette, subfamily B [Carnobacterium iners]|uniref:ATP-binding cassette, subfamily B n=1 Tax=Carnobacterium iners TaxID=1073423 RepID=A0A1X7N1S0_9LACT|nr:ABC transporter ATP-binding protein [Carnobacterium iners]SEK96515.1 ATP-binding cassette, subfamily B [Carnobacterium iners]SMH31255.1 ATP-binding cassette, subfamily B [Carnobacterium iners]
MGSIRWVWKYIRTYWLNVSIGIALVIFVALLNIVSPLIGGRIVDDVIVKGEAGLLVPLLIVMILASLVRTILRYVYQIMFEQIGQNALFNIREEMYRKLQELDFSFFNNTRVGDIMARMTGDTDAIRHAVSWLFYNVLDNFLLLVSAIVVMGIIEWRLMLALVFITPFIGLLTITLSRKANPVFYQIRESFSRLNSMVEENISGNKVVKAFAREEYEIKKFNGYNEDYKNKNLASAAVTKTYLPLLETLASFLSVITIGLGGLLVIDGSMTLGDLVAFNGFIWMLTIPMRNVGWYVNDLQHFITSTYRIRELLATKPKIPLEKRQTTPTIRGIVEFQDVSFHYADDPDTEVLSHISLKASPGQTIGILGETGSGKSTLVNLILRFFDPIKGRILIDGQDARKINVRELRKHIAIVMQDVFLFSETIKENIAFGTPEAELDRIKQVARVADASPFIEEMPDKYNTFLGERGSGLSGGQRQRISLARGLMKDPSILILDDTTSAVDMETEVKIQQELQNVSQKKTTFIIANRISSVKTADEILILSKGEIIERGTHASLLEEKGAYYRIYLEQLGKSDGDEEVSDNGPE